MANRAWAAIGASIALILTTAANAAVYRVTDNGLVEVGSPAADADRPSTPAPLPTMSSAVGASKMIGRALPEPGVFSEQAGSRGRGVPASMPATANLREAYGPLISAAADVYQVDENLLRAVVWQESRFRHRAVSRAGAKGLMQLMPGTARELGVSDVYDPTANVAGGARYLRDLLRRQRGNHELALAAYNAGEGAVRRYRGVPPYRETRAYIAAIRARLAAAVDARR